MQHWEEKKKNTVYAWERKMQGKRLKKHSRFERREKYFKSNFCFHLARLLILAGKLLENLGSASLWQAESSRKRVPRTETQILLVLPDSLMQHFQCIALVLAACLFFMGLYLSHLGCIFVPIIDFHCVYFLTSKVAIPKI